MLGLGSGINRLSAAEAAAIAGRIPGFTGLLDESYGSGAAAAYSVRQLSSSETTAMVIRRDSDNQETSIGFDSNGNLDESAIETFCSGTTCKVSEWRDQSGNRNHAVQTTAANQPTIYTGGAIVKENGRVLIQSDNNDFMRFDLDTQSNYDIFSTHKTDTASVFLGSDSNTDYLFAAESGSTNTSIKSSTVTINSNRVSGAAANLTTRGKIYELFNNRILLYIDASFNYNATSDFRLGYWDNNSFPMYSHQELIFYPASNTHIVSDIESNVGDYFTQNTPLLDTYSGAAGAYSLRKLSSSYSGAAIRVRRDNDNLETDINFNVFGELDTVSLAAHCGSNNGYVTNWYDQSSNSNTARQTTAADQPKIYDSVTGVVTENGKPAVEFVRTSATRLFFGTGLSSQTNIIAVAKNTDTSWGTLVGESFAGGLRCLVSALWDSTTNADDFHHNGSLFLDGVQLTTGTAASNVQRLIFANAASGGYTDSLVKIGQGYTSREWSGPVQEIIFYNSDQSSNRTNIEDNINTFYSIY
jgi:hypothetical protein